MIKKIIFSRTAALVSAPKTNFWLKEIMLSIAFICLCAFNTHSQKLLKGAMAPGLEIKSAEGDTISLRNLRGSVFLVDFWASWCAPCRESNKNHRILFDKYHSKGFQILGISLDIDSIKWRNMVISEGLIWKQALLPGNWQNPLLKQWGVRFLPCSYLLDSTGKIIAVNPGYGILESWLKELLSSVES